MPNHKFKPFARVRIMVANRDSKVSLRLTKPIRAFLDTGASVSVLPPMALEQIQRTGPLKIEDTHLQTANGPKEAKLIKNVSLCLNSICYKGDVAVMDGLTGDILVGSDFLSTSKCTIDFEKKRIKCKKGEIKFRMEH